jgi:hypothetical protein
LTVKKIPSLSKEGGATVSMAAQLPGGATLGWFVNLSLLAILSKPPRPSGSDPSHRPFVKDGNFYLAEELPFNKSCDMLSPWLSPFTKFNYIITSA